MKRTSMHSGFPAPELRAYRQELAMLADATPADRVAPIMDLVLGIDRLVRDHEDFVSASREIGLRPPMRPVQGAA